jgi:adenylate cyclase
MGDGLLVVFNDPLPCADHTERAVRMAAEMRDELDLLAGRWMKKGHDLGFGIGIARGHATIGRIGFDQRWDYAVIGSVPNLAARLCDEAAAGQILVSQKVIGVIENSVESRATGSLNLKGFHRPVPAYQVVRWLG